MRCEDCKYMKLLPNNIIFICTNANSDKFHAFVGENSTYNCPDGELKYLYTKKDSHLAKVREVNK